MERPTCKKCASPNLVVIESGPHLKLICADCNTYQKFITKAEAELYLKKENKNDEIKTLESRIAELEENHQSFVEHHEAQQEEWYERSKDWDEEKEKLEAENKRLKEACAAAIPCLEDWIATTGFGETNRRDRNALQLIINAMKAR